MSVSQRGYVALSQGAVGRSISWPAGTAAGDVAVLVLTDSDGRAPASGPSGWTFGRRYVWWRGLTAAGGGGAPVAAAGGGGGGGGVFFQLTAGAGGAW